MKVAPMKVDGACHCGRITFRAEIDPGEVRICHCSDCQTFSGSAFRVSVTAKEGSFELLSGAPRVYIKTGDSGRKRAQGFCAECGTAIYSIAAEDGSSHDTPTHDDPKRYTLRVGSLRQGAALRPSAQYWCGSAVTWLADLPSIQQIQGD
jgi:hypothetical protein